MISVFEKIVAHQRFSESFTLRNVECFPGSTLAQQYFLITFVKNSWRIISEFWCR